MLGEFVVRVANLVEAEGRAARRGATDFLAVACAWVGGTLLGVASLIALAAAIFRGLVDGLGLAPGWAYVVIALLLGLSAGGCGLAAQYLRRQRRVGP